jgi:hypothetical protein
MEIICTRWATNPSATEIITSSLPAKSSEFGKCTPQIVYLLFGIWKQKSTLDEGGVGRKYLTNLYTEEHLPAQLGR